jgi:integrase
MLLPPQPELIIIPPQANTGTLSTQEIERMARRRYQSPEPFRRGRWWIIRVWRDEFTEGKLIRRQKWERLGPASVSDREILKMRDEHMRPLNQGLESLLSTTSFEHFVTMSYKPLLATPDMMAASSRERTLGVLKNHLLPVFGKCSLRELSMSTLQQYFSHLGTKPLSHESRDKIRDVMSAVMRYAIECGLLIRNPMENVRMPRDRRGRRQMRKQYLTPKQFEELLALVSEPYATMFYVAIYTGLRVSELIGLKWEDIHESSITIDERCCRGDWGSPKSEASNATIAVNRCVIERIHRLRLLTVEVKAGSGTRKFRVVKSDGPTDLVFQSVQKGRSMRDNNILSRHLKPAARTLGLDWVNWRCLRTSHATWLKMAGADVKDAQAQMRHSRASTTLDVYQQFVPESQQKVVDKLSSLLVN